MENVGPLLGGVPFVPPCTGWNIWVNQTPRPVVFVEVRSVVPGTSSDLHNWRTSRGRVKYVNVIKISNYFVIYVSCLCSNDKMEKSWIFFEKVKHFFQKTINPHGRKCPSSPADLMTSLGKWCHETPHENLLSFSNKYYINRFPQNSNWICNNRFL